MRKEGIIHRLYAITRDEEWHNLFDLAGKVNAPVDSVSARLRDLRRDKRFPIVSVDSRRRGGTTQYRVRCERQTSSIPA